MPHHLPGSLILNKYIVLWWLAPQYFPHGGLQINIIIVVQLFVQLLLTHLLEGPGHVLRGVPPLSPLLFVVLVLLINDIIINCDRVKVLLVVFVKGEFVLDNAKSVFGILLKIMS